MLNQAKKHALLISQAGLMAACTLDTSHSASDWLLRLWAIWLILAYLRRMQDRADYICNVLELSNKNLLAIHGLVLMKRHYGDDAQELVPPDESGPFRP